MSYVISPESGRRILVGGPTYRRLMRKQIAKEQARNMQEDAAQQVVDEDVLLDPYENLNYIQPLPDGNTRHPIKKVLKKKIGKRRIRQQPTQEEVSHYTAASSSKVFQNNMGELVDQASVCRNDQDLVDLANHLQKLILAEMMKKQDKEATGVQQRQQRLSTMTKSIERSRSIKPKKPQRYELEEQYTDEVEYE